VSNNNTQLGPFGHQLRAIALASNAESDIRRWNAYAIAQDRKLTAERKARQGIPVDTWFYSQSWHR
jgi:hypothetical protein